MVQVVILFGGETWVLSAAMLNKLKRGTREFPTLGNRDGGSKDRGRYLDKGGAGQGASGGRD